MRRAERLAWLAVGGLVTIAVILIAGAFAYRVTSFWAGAMLACGQAVVVGLGAWGLGLARQAAELREGRGTLPHGHVSDGGIAAPAGGSGFRMSMGEESESMRAGGAAVDAKVLDVGFQRVLVGATGVVLAGLAGLMGWAIYVIYQWSLANPTVPVPVVGTLTSAAKNAEKGVAAPGMDELCLLTGLAGAAIYAVLFWITRPTRETEGYGEATSSSFTLGITGMAALGVATLLGYFRVAWAGETAAAIITALLALQGLELLANSFRSFSGIEELEQEAVDLQVTPLTPMLVSVWLGGLRILFAQSVGLYEGGKKGERGVVSRMMPRALLAMLVLAIGASCIRVVKPGHVAILERLGYTPLEADGRRPQAGAILHAGMHLKFPWPIDVLVDIPTEQLQTVSVGTELHATGAWKNVDFQFWTIRPPGADENETDDLFITGDTPSPQFLETYVQVQWRVADPARFYAAMSHSEFVEKETAEARTLPMYQAMVQQCTSWAVTRTFAIHSLEQILITDRREAEEHCRQILQEKLDAMCALPSDKAGAATRGIDVMYVTIRDLHPPYWHADRQVARGTRIGGLLVKDETGKYIVVDNPEQTSVVERGPASAFELVVSMREFMEQMVNTAQGEAIKMKNEAHGDALSAIFNAQAYATEKVARARGDADRLVEMTRGLSANELELLKRKTFYDTFKSLFDPVSKVVVDPEVQDVQIIQSTGQGAGGFRPPGQ
jgi:regulator of protease activity HflC (stomatin/prohibitin superfamily)